MPDLILHGIRKTYPNGAVGLLPTDLAIADRECFVLLGPSGSGKTTLLRLIAGLENPDAGTLEIAGARAELLPPHQRGVSFVTQRPALYPHLDVSENLAISLRFEQARLHRKYRISGVSIQQRVREAAELLGLPNLLKRRVHELSGGELRRVVLGRALVAQRKIWLLDEPFSQLDPPLRDRLCRELHLLRRRLGITIVHVTHDSNEALTLADRVGVLDQGRLLQAGKPAEVLAQPGHRSVAECFGWPPINLIEGCTGPDGVGYVFAANGPFLLGIRPEDVKLDRVPEGMQLGCGEVIGSQPLGGNWLTEVRTGGLLLRSFGPAQNLGRNVDLWIDPVKLHVFDARSGERLKGVSWTAFRCCPY